MHATNTLRALPFPQNRPDPCPPNTSQKKVLLAAGLSDLASGVPPDGRSKTCAVVETHLEGSNAQTMERGAGAKLDPDSSAMSPPSVTVCVSLTSKLAHAHASASLTLNARKDTTNGFLAHATPARGSFGSRAALVATPTTQFTTNDNHAPAFAAFAATTTTTPEAHQAVTTTGGAITVDSNTVHDLPSLEVEVHVPTKPKLDEAPTPVPRAGKNVSFQNELLSPATALAVEFLAGVGATAIGNSKPNTDGTDMDTNSGNTGNTNGSERLFQKFQSAAVDLSVRKVSKTKTTFFDPAANKPEPFQNPPPRGVKRRTLGEAVTQFQHETQAAALSFGFGGVGLCGVVAQGRVGDVSQNVSQNESQNAESQSLYAALAPAAKKRKARRWLSADEKQFACGIDGCQRAYGSASSLCAHKRGHHPGWKERRRDARIAEAISAAARGETPVARLDDDDDDDDDDDGDGGKQADDNDDDDVGDDQDVAGRQARKEGANALDANARATPSGAWIESLAADAHARLGALRRSRQRVQRGLRDARVATAKLGAPREGRGTQGDHGIDNREGSIDRDADSVAAACAARLLSNFESALDLEQDTLHAWLGKLERVAELRQAAGRVLRIKPIDLSGGFEIRFPQLTAPATRSAAKTAQDTADALAGAANASATGPGSKKEKTGGFSGKKEKMATMDE